MPSNLILCVDDDNDTCDLLTTLLGFSGIELVSVHNASEARRMIERKQFSLYIIDGQLPDVSGLSFCEQIREMDKNTPIVIFSGRAYQTDIAAGIRAGATAYVIKPNTSDLAATVKRLLESAHVATA